MVKTVQEFIRSYPVRRYARNEIILLQSDIPKCLYAIKEGYVKGYDIDTQGAEQLVWLGAPGDLFSLVWAFSPGEGIPVPYFFSAFNDVELHMVNRAEFLEFLNKSHEALLEVTKKLAHRLEDAFRQLNATEKAKAEEKIAHTLHFLSMRFGDRVKRRKHVRQIMLPITHQDIANLLGLTRETVTVELKKLKDRGYIFYDKAHFIIHQDKLEQLL